MQKRKHTNDPLELAFESLLIKHGINYTLPEEVGGVPVRKLDFHLTDFSVSVEVKAYSTPRLHEQLVGSGKEAEGIIVLVGMGAVEALWQTTPECRGKTLDYSEVVTPALRPRGGLLFIPLQKTTKNPLISQEAFI